MHPVIKNAVIYQRRGPAGIGPFPKFTGTPLTGAAPLDVTFSNTTNGEVTDWLWEKNDGGGWVNFDGSPTAEAPTETFAEGTWSVRLTATGPDGQRTRTRTNYIQSGVVASTYAPMGIGWLGDPVSGLWG